MADRKAFPLRIDATVHAALEKWAADELRSVNAHIEFLLREALRKSGRLRSGDDRSSDDRSSDDRQGSD